MLMIHSMAVAAAVAEAAFHRPAAEAAVAAAEAAVSALAEEQESLQATVRVQGQSKAMDERLARASDAEIEQAWLNLQSGKAPALGDPIPSPAAKRKQLVSNLKSEESLAFKNADDTANRQKFALTRDTLRIILLALIYAWAFYGIAKL